MNVPLLESKLARMATIIYDALRRQAENSWCVSVHGDNFDLSTLIGG